MTEAEDRAIWFEGYVRTYLERDLQDLARIANLPDFRRVVQGACHRIGQLVNQSELARDVALPQPTVHRWLNLLETSCLLVRLPAYAVNRTKRLVKSPKFYFADVGLALHLTGGREPSGAHFENLVLADLLAWRDGRLPRADLHYWRTQSGEEVDFVVETADGLVLPIEVKAARRVRFADTSGILAFRREYADRSRPGLVLYDGPPSDPPSWVAPGVLAVPWWRML